MSRIATLHMLRSAISDSLRSHGFIISWLNHTPRTTAVYASCSALPPPHATLASRRPATALPGPGLHRLDRASFAWRLPLVRSPPRERPAAFAARQGRVFAKPRLTRKRLALPGGAGAPPSRREIGHEFYEELGAGKLDRIDFKRSPADEAQNASDGLWGLNAAWRAFEYA